MHLYFTVLLDRVVEPPGRQDPVERHLDDFRPAGQPHAVRSWHAPPFS